MNRHLRSLMLVCLSIILGLGLFLWLVGKTGFFDIIKVFRTFPLYWLIFFFMLSITINLFLALRWRIILSYIGYKVKYSAIFVYHIMGASVSYLTPSAHIGGEPVRVFMLTKHDVKPADAWSSVLMDKTMELSADLFFSIIGLLILFFFFNAPAISYILMFLGLFFAVFLVILFYSRLARNEKMFAGFLKKIRIDKFRIGRKIVEKISEVEESMCSLMRQGRKGFYKAISLSTFLWVLMYFEFFCALSMVGVKPTLPHIFLVGCFISISFLMPVPGALGVMEAGQIGAFSLLGYPASSAIAFSLIIRGRDLIKTFIGIILLSHKGINILSVLKPGKKKE